MSRWKNARVAVLMGGRSAEREVSLVSGSACASALEEAGFSPIRLDAADRLVEQLIELRPDVCFNALHGRLGEDGRVQGALDLLGIPYTHSGVLASALAMDKPQAKRVFQAVGLRCPQGVETSYRELTERGAPLDGPIVVKPSCEGSSVGVLIAPDGNLAPLARRNDVDPDQRLLVETYVEGRELTCAVLDDEALAVTEIVPREGFYDYRAKYTAGYADHVVPADIPPETARTVMEWTLRAHRALGCRGTSRCDFRWDSRLPGAEGLYLLEINTQPGMTPMSLVPEQAAQRGISFVDLVQRLLETAQCDG
ncbi:D-alanine--D-alanine ligase [Geminicoccus roseus]|uniref:D-alanine--D-alanine ligase n=1 Tax=Geminicoccus roseus TaxID=404900 RepID=UPI000426CD15|nr:D-alanine--D-alanine ligase [Geminicoccus roseus]